MLRWTVLVLLSSLVYGALGCTNGLQRVVESGLPYEVQILSMAVSPNYERDQTLLIGTWSGIYRSEDGGSTWTASSKGLERTDLSLPVIDIAFSPAFARDRHVYAATRLGLLKSTDGGRSWPPVDPPEVRRITPSDTTLTDMPVEVAVSPRYAEDARVLAVYRMVLPFSPWLPPERRVLYESTDGGEAWTRIGDGEGAVPTYDIQVYSDGAVMGSTGDRVLLRRSPSGAWETIAEYGPSYRVVLPQLDQDDRPVVLANGLGETVRVTDEGDPVLAGFRLGQRTRACLGVERPAGYGFGPDCLTTFAGAVRGEGGPVFAVPDEGGRDDRAGIMRSDDGGRSWTRLDVPTFERIVAVAVSPGYSEDRTVFTAARSRVFRSTDDGETWHATRPGCEWDPMFPSSVDWAPIEDMDDMERFFKGRTVVKVRAIDYERVDKDGIKVVNTADVIRVLAGEVPEGPVQIRDGFNTGSPSFDGHGRCLVAGAEYYLILKTGYSGSGAASFDMSGHPLTQFAVRNGHIVVAPLWDEFLLGKELSGMREAKFAEELERALVSK